MIDVTALSGYSYCPRKLFLCRVLKLVRPPKGVMVKGSIKHDFFDKANKTEEKIVSSIMHYDLEKIQSIYKQEYFKLLKSIVLARKYEIKEVKLQPIDVFNEIMPKVQREVLFRAENVFSFIQKQKIFGKELWQSLIPKIETELKLVSDNLQLKGKIDRVEVYPNCYIPIELKSGKAPEEGVWLGNKIQLGAYILLLEEHFKKEIQKGYVNYIDSDIKREVCADVFLREEIKLLIKKVHELLKSQEMPEICDNRNKCRNCEFRERCEVFNT